MNKLLYRLFFAAIGWVYLCILVGFISMELSLFDGLSRTIALVLFMPLWLIGFCILFVFWRLGEVR